MTYETIQFAEANPQKVKALLDYLVKAFEDYCDNALEEDVQYLDVFMAVHNFHCVIVLDIEARLGTDPQGQLFFRQMAIDTFKLAMENKPAYKQTE